MKYKSKALTLLLLFTPFCVGIGANLPSVTIQGSAHLTWQPMSTACLNDIVQSGCASSGCDVSGKKITFSSACQGPVSLTLQNNKDFQCSNSQAELTLNPGGGWYDISLVNGFSKSVSIQPDGATGSQATSVFATGYGIYPYGCTKCNKQGITPCPRTSQEAEQLKPPAPLPPKDMTPHCPTDTQCQASPVSTTNFTVIFGG